MPPTDLKDLPAAEQFAIGQISDGLRSLNAGLEEAWKLGLTVSIDYISRQEIQRRDPLQIFNATISKKAFEVKV